MVSDVSIDELHEFAKQAGIPRHWFHNAKFPHYDLNPINREKALTLNAKEVSSKEIVLAVRRSKWVQHIN
jgi:hypothetical protein